jgi:hypothetical protein
MKFDNMNFDLKKAFAGSVALHVLGLYMVVDVQPQPEEEIVEVSFYDAQTLEKLAAQPEILEKMLAQDEMNSLEPSVLSDKNKPELQETLDKVVSNLEQLQKMMEESRKRAALSRTLSELQLLGEKRDDYGPLYNLLYKERNEDTFAEFFRKHLSMYLLRNEGGSDAMWKSLERNKRLEDVLHITVRFQKSGKFYLEDMKPPKRLHDPGRKIEKHYKRLMRMMPNRFVSPEEAGLPTPYRVSYKILNPEREMKPITPTVPNIGRE